MKRVMTEEVKAKIKASRENVKIHNITDKYRVVGRSEYLTLEKKGKDDNWGVVGYHTELSHAIVSVSKHVVRDDIDDLVHVSGQLEEIKKLCTQLLNK